MHKPVEADAEGRRGLHLRQVLAELAHRHIAGGVVRHTPAAVRHLEGAGESSTAGAVSYQRP